ncbi:MAG: hypothetical protein WC910_10280 [Bacteroidales bacterium]
MQKQLQDHVNIGRTSVDRRICVLPCSTSADLAGPGWLGQYLYAIYCQLGKCIVLPITAAFLVFDSRLTT